jgi:alkanesulfonate monooxygenase SsuD/methylene tetrahydromethanopterin reductase-like flavin-dependent oxidoreductase (luciferase family)
MRNPAQLGKVIATVDNISGGRIIPGLGAGWMPREFTDFGVPFLSTGKRLGQLRETVELLKRMWGDEPQVTYEGKYVQAHNLVCEPKPVRKPPLLIGGAGEQVTLKLAAEHADIWNNLAVHQGALARKIEVLKEHCATVGRPLGEVTISQQCLVTIAPDEASAGPMVETAKKIFGGHMGDPTGPLGIAGSPETVRRQIQAHIDLGCTMFVMEFFGRDTREAGKLFAETVLPHFR